MLNETSLKKFTSWTSFLAIVTIVGGVISCLTIVGLIPGLISVYLGIKLWNAKNIAGQLLTEGESENVITRTGLLLEELAMYFKVNGILILISFAFAIISIIAAVLFFTYAVVERGFNFY